MVVTDPLYTIRTWFDPSSANKVTQDNLTLDDASTRAKYEAEYWYTEANLDVIYNSHNLDVVFIIHRLGVKPLDTPSGPIGYVHRIGVQPACTEKFVDGAKVLTGDIMMHKANNEVRRVLRTNMSGSMRLSDREVPKVERLGSSFIYGDIVEVTYIQYVTSYADTTDLVSERRFFNHIHELAVGVTSAAADHSKIGESSGIGPVWWGPAEDPIRRIPIPGGYFAVKQLIGNYDLIGYIQIHDVEAVTQLLRIIDVVSGGATETAVEWDSTPTRNAVGYLAVTVNNTAIANTGDARTPETSTFVFAGNVYIATIQPRFESAAGHWLVKFYADYVTQTDA